MIKITLKWPRGTGIIHMKNVVVDGWFPHISRVHMNRDITKRL